jgi:hypothetical protein
MPFTAFDDDVSGSGSASFSGAGLFYVSVDVTTLGPIPRPVDDADHFIRAGWFSLGDEFDIGLGTFEYWGPVVYVDFEHFRWTPTPDYDTNGVFALQFATRIRWHFAPGVEAHIHAFAN